MEPSIEATFPNITRWVKEFGDVQIGYDRLTDTFIRAVDEGGMVWGGGSRFGTIDEALDQLERAIGEIFDDRASSRKTSTANSHQVKTVSRKAKGRQRVPDPLPKQVYKLEEIVEAIRRNEGAEITRLTVVKKLCENPGAAGAFAVFLAKKAQARLREKHGEKRYSELSNRAIREMKPYVEGPTEDRKEKLWSLLHEIEAEQNEYKSTRWGLLRNIKSWDLLILEKCLRSILRRDEATYWLYQATRDYVGGSVSLERDEIPRIEEIARFWRRYFKAQAGGGS
jgi:hypothetical protein